MYSRGMDFLYQFQGVTFTWDADKAQSNIEKHGVTFEEAVEVFFDPFYQTGDAAEDGESREFMLGYSLAPRLLWLSTSNVGNRPV